MNDDSESGSRGGSTAGDTPTGGTRRATDALVGQLIADRYRVERTVSVGAHTVIVDATDTELNRVVTLKLIRPEFSEVPDFQGRFEQTMQAMSSLSHPNIAAVYGWGKTTLAQRTTCYVVVEHLTGGSFRDLFDRGRYLSPSQALVVGLEACRALDEAHRRSIVHTEITPSKLVFGEDRRLRVIDFGLARLLGMLAWSEPSNLATHTARYASPEQAQRQPLDGKADVYALALTLVEAVTGRVPFSADSTVATLNGRIGKLMPVSADLGSLAAVLERAGRPDREGRWTAAEFGRALVRAAGMLPRPEPIPLIVNTLFSDPPSRRSDDPTGGLERPPEQTFGDGGVGDAVAEPVDGTPAVPPADAATSDDDATERAEPEPEPEPAESQPEPTGNAPAGAGASAASPSGAAHDRPDLPDGDRETDEPSSGAGAPGQPPMALPGEPLAVLSPRPSAPERGREQSESPPPDAPDQPSELPADSPPDAPPVTTAPAAASDAPSDASQRLEPADEPPTEPPGTEAAAAPATAGTATEAGERDGPHDTDTPDEHTTAAGAPDGGAAPAGGPIAGQDDAAADEGDGGDGPEAKPRLYDGEDDVTRDELAHLAGPVDDDEDAADAEPALAGAVASGGGASGDGTDRSPAADSPKRSWIPRMIVAVLLLAALGGLGVTGYLLFRAERHEVPPLTGLTEEDARLLVEPYDWEIETRLDRSDEVPEEGHVIRSEPESGEQLAEGGQFLLILSEGPEFRELPELREMTRPDAIRRLGSLQLTGSVANRVFDEDVPQGQVVRWSVADDPDLVEGDEVLPDTEIELVMSRGPAPREVPDLSDMSPREAREVLDDLRLEMDRGQRMFHETIERGNVARQRPRPGNELERGETVTIRVSKGPDLVEFPDLEGLGERRARQRLANAGFELRDMRGAVRQGSFERAMVARGHDTPADDCEAGSNIRSGKECLRGTPIVLVYIT